MILTCEGHFIALLEGAQEDGENVIQDGQLRWYLKAGFQNVQCSQLRIHASSNLSG
jgi:hypothetical protein